MARAQREQRAFRGGRGRRPLTLTAGINIRIRAQLVEHRCERRVVGGHVARGRGERLDHALELTVWVWVAKKACGKNGV
jgi:hypothetical protein